MDINKSGAALQSLIGKEVQRYEYGETTIQIV